MNGASWSHLDVISWIVSWMGLVGVSWMGLVGQLVG